MPCIDRTARRAWLLAASATLASCAQRQLPPWPSPPAPAVPVPPPVTTAPAPSPSAGAAVTPPPASPPTPPPAAAAPPSPAAAPPAAAVVPPKARRVVRLKAPPAARNWDEFKLQAARRLVEAHPEGTYLGPVPEPLLAIPVLEVEFNADGSVRHVGVLRRPRQALDTVQMAIDAIHQAAPYGAMARLPLPWKWAAVFLFDDDRRFKPRELDA